VFFSCKKPKAEFQLKKLNYAAGDMLEYENYSSNQYTCVWHILDVDYKVVAEYDGNYPAIRLSVLLKDGMYYLRLTAMNKKENKVAISESKPFIVNSTKYTMTINPNGAGSNGQSSYQVFVDGEFIGEGKPTNWNTSNGRFSANIPVGIRHIRLVSPTKVKNEVRNVTMQFSIVF
jgi:archaellum component FlaF (FlaF/FlaG flagellin family)